MSDAQPQVTVVIVTYCSRATIGCALDALHEAHQQSLANVVVVDNASQDETANHVAEHYPWVTLVRSEENLGYGRGCNCGFDHVDTPYVFILNPDAVADAGAIRTLLDFMQQHPQAGVAAPAIREGSGWQAAGLMTTPGTVLRGALGISTPYPNRRMIDPGSEPFQTDWVCGAAMLIRSEMYRDLGGFDPRFFLYFEETDLCRRVAARGAQLWAVGEAVIEHVGGASAKSTGETIESSCIAQHFYQSRFYYLIKHFGWFRAIAVESIAAAAQSLRRIRDWIRRRPTSTHSSTRPFLQLPAMPEDAA